MSLKFNPNIAAAPIYAGGKSTEEVQVKYGLEEVIKIGSNESPLGPSLQAIEAMQRAVTTLNRYPTMGDDDLRTVLASVIGRELTPDNFFTGNGGCDVLWMVANSFLSSGDECIICRPTFPVYDSTARRIGASVVYVDLDPEDFTYDIEAILAAVTERTRLVYVCSPNNPTGNLLTAPQMETLVNNMPSQALIVTDEVYHHFVTDDNFADSIGYVRAGKNVLIVHSFSKVFGLAGLRLGYGIAPAEITRYIARMRQPFHLSRVTLEGGMAALQDRAYIEKTVELVVHGREWLYQQLAGLELKVWPGQGNFLLFKPPTPAGQVAEELLKRGVIVRPLAGFYLPDHIRVTAGLPEENERFINALKAVLVELKPS
jgi:histidinol-phosphate aminotransferase